MTSVVGLSYLLCHHWLMQKGYGDIDIVTDGFSKEVFVVPCLIGMAGHLLVADLLLA